MIFGYVIYLYYKLKGYLYSNNDTKVQYRIPFDIDLINKDENYHKYEDINKTIFALNNMPDVVHHLLFGNKDNIAFNYYYIRLDIEKKEIDHNLDLLESDMLNKDIRYIFIRLNLINSQNHFNHVNGIYINKNKKYVLIFEPKVELSFTKDLINSFLRNNIDLSKYKFIYAEDLGYNIYNRMQNYDLFCQTYVLFVFLLITLNDDMIEYDNYSTMFQSVINSKNIGYLLYHINTLLLNNNYDICDQPELWTLSSNKFKKIKNLIKYLIDNKKEEDITKFIIKEDGDLFIIDNNYDDTKSLGMNELEDNDGKDDECNLNILNDPVDNISPPDMVDVDLLDV